MYEKKLVNKTQKLPLGKLPLGNFLYLCTEIVKFVTKLPIFMKNIGIRSQKSHGWCIKEYWHTYDQKEVDVVIGDAKVAIEIKSTEHVETKHKKGLKAFNEEHPDCRLILVSLDPITRRSGDEELIYVQDFLRMLWNGEIFWF